MKYLWLLLLAPLISGCVTTGPGSVAGGECKFLERPPYAVKGATQYDQDWIDPTVESAVGACGWERPATRPPELDAPPIKPHAKHVAKPAKKKHKLAWLRDLKWPKRAIAPVVIVPEAPAPVVVEPPPPPPPAPCSPADELLQSCEAAQ